MGAHSIMGGVFVVLASSLALQLLAGGSPAARTLHAQETSVSLMVCGDGGAAATGTAPPDAAAVEAVSQVKGQHEASLLQVPGVVGAGIGLSREDGAVVVQVYVSRVTDAIRKAVPACLDGVRVEIVETGTFEAR